MRLSAIPADRCQIAIQFGTNLITRCMFQRGHNGPHEGKGLKKFPYQRVKWFQNDSRCFTTTRNHEFAWSERKYKEKR